ncbi:alkaline phosphatase [Photobacterium sagamiensis]|uniref:alkaline phosphatase n=1 Tax=Photobacterium sagamiensis TaxID=2910241 RepID=UPI003D0E90E8
MPVLSVDQSLLSVVAFFAENIFGSETHSGEDVAIFSQGPKAHLFQGAVEKTIFSM